MAGSERIFGMEIPFVEHCAIEPIAMSEDARSRLRIRLSAKHANNHGAAHGGLIATLADVAMGSAARQRAGFPVVTVDMHTTFLSPGHGTLIAEGWVVKSGRSMLFCECTITNEADELVAKGSGVFKAQRR